MTPLIRPLAKALLAYWNGRSDSTLLAECTSRRRSCLRLGITKPLPFTVKMAANRALGNYDASTFGDESCVLEMTKLWAVVFEMTVLAIASQE